MAFKNAQLDFDGSVNYYTQHTSDSYTIPASPNFPFGDPSPTRYVVVLDEAIFVDSTHGFTITGKSRTLSDPKTTPVADNKYYITPISDTSEYPEPYLSNVVEFSASDAGESVSITWYGIGDVISSETIYSKGEVYTQTEVSNMFALKTKITSFTNGSNAVSQSFTTGCLYAKFILYGGGGGGGGSYSTTAGGGGGGGGLITICEFNNPAGTFSVYPGAAGSAGANGSPGSNGGNGGNTTLYLNGTSSTGILVGTANGGSLGSAASSASGGNGGNGCGGGGGGGRSSSAGTGGTGQSSFGRNGSNGSSFPPTGGGGGKSIYTSGGGSSSSEQNGRGGASYGSGGDGNSPTFGGGGRGGANDIGINPSAGAVGGAILIEFF